MEVLATEILSNSLYFWLGAVAVGLLVYVILRTLHRVLLGQLRRLNGRTDAAFNDIIVEVVQATRGWFRVGMAIWAGTTVLAISPLGRERIGRLVALLLLLQIGLWVSAGIRAYMNRYISAHVENDPSSVTTVRALGYVGVTIVWAAVVLVALDNLGVEVTAMVAGLGIGGVAVALAVQNILGDLFASLSIVLDKPFVYGDFIIVDDMLGTVEKVGLKTTRIRSLSGEQLVFSNSDLLQSRIRNYKRMYERRVVFNFRVPYGTPREKVAEIPGLVRKAIEAQDGVRFDRAHFFRFTEWALEFEAVYYVLSPDYNAYMDRQQAINLLIMEYLEEREVEFAQPVRMVRLEESASAI